MSGRRRPASRAPSAEEELILLLCGRRPHREAGAGRIIALAERSDLELLRVLLEDRLLLPLVGSRLVDLAPSLVPDEFVQRVAAASRHNRHRAVLQQSVIGSILGALEEAEVAAVPLKGAPLAEAIYGDPGLRFSGDLDLLVHPKDLPVALDVLRRLGYGESRDLPWDGGLPMLHHALPPERPGLPPVELHWRIHWHETRFSPAMLARSVPSPGPGRRLQPADELAAQLLFFARDSFFGLRLAADLAAWWDTRGHELPSAALDPIAAAHPELRRSIGAALLVAERLVRLPAGMLLSARWPLDERGRTAARLANWTGSGEPAELVANLMAVDWLLTPRGERRSFARRYMFQPADAIARTYGRPETAGVRNEALRLVHGLARTAKFAHRYAAVRRKIRGGADWAPRPDGLNSRADPPAGDTGRDLPGRLSAVR